MLKLYNTDLKIESKSYVTFHTIDVKSLNGSLNYALKISVWNSINTAKSCKVDMCEY